MKHLQDFFNLTHKERNGFLVLTIFILLLTIVPWVWSFTHKAANPEYTLHVFPSSAGGRASHEVFAIGSRSEANKKITDIYPFNPNNLPAAAWAKFGLSPKQIAVIHRYEAKGGTFRTKEDVQKMYVIDAVLYRKLAPFIQIPAANGATADVNSAPHWQNTKPATSRQDYRAKEELRPVRIDINRSDTTDWKMIRGIGSVYAARIVRFRELLGGFHQIEQVREVYGLPLERLDEWLAQLYLESPTVRKIQINQLNAEELQKHPYISRKQAVSIVTYRKQHGAYHSLEDMRRIVVLDTDFFTKIEPYLDFQ